MPKPKIESFEQINELLSGAGFVEIADFILERDVNVDKNGNFELLGMYFAAYRLKMASEEFQKRLTIAGIEWC